MYAGLGSVSPKLLRLEMASFMAGGRTSAQVQPPSTMKSCAVHIALSSAARNSTMLAMCCEIGRAHV